MSPYLALGIGCAVLGAVIGAAGMHCTVDAAQLSKEQAAHARDTSQYTTNMKAVSDKAAIAASDALKKQTQMQRDADAAQTTITKLQGKNDALDKKYRDSLATGTQRLRVAVRNCTAVDTASGSAAGNDSQSSGSGNDTASTADLDPTVAASVFAVAADDQREINKLVQLQAWACTVKPDAPGCQK